MTIKPTLGVVVVLAVLLSNLLFVDRLCAQDAAEAHTDSLVLQALRQELARSTTLQLDDFPTPFFVSYTLRDEQKLTVQGSLGALSYSQQQPSRACRIRLMLGNSKLTNELSDSYRSEVERIVTVDTGVTEMRRTLWLATDALYKDAAEEYANKQTALKQTNLPEDERDLYDFSSEVPLQMYIPNTASMPSQHYWEDVVRRVSAVMADYPQLSSSLVTFVASVSNVYFVNTEGTVVRQPLNYATLSVSATLTQDDGKKLGQRLYLVESDGRLLPSADSLVAASRRMAEQLLAVSRAPLFDDSYSGPVLVEGDALQSVLANELFMGTRSLVGHRDRISGSRSRTLDDKMGKKILASNLTVRDMPGLQWYAGRYLIGAQAVDMEGVIPAASRVLVHNGILKGLLTDRVPTKSNRVSTGSARMTIDNEEIMVETSPSVIKIEAEGGIGPDSLKRRLMTQAKAEGYAYTYIVRGLSGYTRPQDLYKVDVETGQEQLVQGAEWSQLSLNTLKRVDAVSAEVQVDNVLIGGMPCSMIVPKALIMQDIDIDKEREAAKYKAPLVSNPAKEKKEGGEKSKKKKK